MKGVLLVALILGSSTAVTAGMTKPKSKVSQAVIPRQRKITSRNDLMFGHLIGRSRSEIIAIKGEPVDKKQDTFVYRQRLGPGAHSFRYSWVVKFRRDKVVEVEEFREAVGCILIPPPRERP